MAIEITNYQCPSCMGPLHFSSESGNLDCEYCGESFEVETIEMLYADKEQAVADAESNPEWQFNNNVWSEDEAASMRAYTCPSCGAEIICDDTTAATSCPYCDNPTVIPSQFTGTLKPDFIIPFKVSKWAAKKALKEHYKGKKFLPKYFSSENKIDEIKGIYVPFWLFDGTSNADIRYRATKVHSYTDGDYNLTVTENYHVVRQGSVTFTKVPVDGSIKMPDSHMDAIEPYNYSELVDFSTAYLPGYLADKYDMDAEVCSERANKRIHKSTQNAFASTARGYSTLVPETSIIDINAGDVKYALLPVWMLSTKWKGENFLFAMNGQTGKLIGDLPVDWGKFWLWFACISLPLMLLLGIILL